MMSSSGDEVVQATSGKTEGFDRQTGCIILSAEAYAEIMELVEHPREPSERLIRAMAQRGKIVLPDEDEEQ